MKDPNNYEDWPDMTFEELKESDEYDTDEMNLIEDTSQVLGEYQDAMVILSGTIALGKMLEDGHITLREYIRLSDYLEEWERDLDESPLR